MFEKCTNCNKEFTTYVNSPYKHCLNCDIYGYCNSSKRYKGNIIWKYVNDTYSVIWYPKEDLANDWCTIQNNKGKVLIRLKHHLPYNISLNRIEKLMTLI